MKKKQSLENKKVLLLLNAFYSANNSISGGDIRALKIFKQLNLKKLTIITNKKALFFIEKEKINADIFLTKDWFEKTYIGISYLLRTFQAIFFIKNKNFDIIYVSSDFFPDVLPAYLYKNFHKTKWIQCIYHIYPNWLNRPGNKIRNLISQYLQKISFILIKKSDKIININSQVKDCLANQHLYKDKIQINGLGIDVNFISKINSKKEFKSDAIFLGRLVYSKGIFDLIKILKKITNKYPNFKLNIIGEGKINVKKNFLSKIKKSNLEKNINLLGYLDDKNKYEFMKSSKIFIFPSYEEGFSISILEALACGLSVIAWKLPVYKTIYKDNINQIPIGNYELFAKKIETLINFQKQNYHINLTNKYSWEKIAKNEKKIIFS